MLIPSVPQQQHHLIKSTRAIFLFGREALERLEQEGFVSTKPVVDDVELSTSTVGIGKAGIISLLANGSIAIDNARVFSTVEAGGVAKDSSISGSTIDPCANQNQLMEA